MGPASWKFVSVVRLLIIFQVVAIMMPETAAERQLYYLRFVQEPPARIDFYNTTGARLYCSARGSPTPSVAWQTYDGRIVEDVPNLRYVRPEGTLEFPPFPSESYRQSVHAATYRCVASNAIGKASSRLVRVRAVVAEKYKVQVFDEFVTPNITAVLRCSIPSFVRDYVTVTSWTRDNYPINTSVGNTKDDRYTIFPTGELHVRNVRMDDSYKNFRCFTRNRLTGEVAQSRNSGKLIVTEAKSIFAPSITHKQPLVEADVGSTVLLPCAAQGNPPPSYRWLKTVEDFGIPRKRPVQLGDRFHQLSGTLRIHSVSEDDSGKFECHVNNTGGHDIAETELIVRAPLSATVTPSEVKTDIGNAVTFRCNISGRPVDEVSWFINLQPVPLSARVRLLPKDSLHITSVQREDKGIYQCMSRNDRDSAQGTSVLLIEDDPPIFKDTFQPRLLKPSSTVSLKCLATGNPLPQITWTLDDFPVPEERRFSQGDFVTSQAEVVSFVNISRIRTEDGGLYRCTASNEVGSTVHEALIQVHGPPVVRKMADRTQVDGKTMSIRCPASGHPINEVIWEHNNRRIPYNHRQTASDNGTLVVNQLDHRTDAGHYKCTAKGPQGKRAEGSVNVIIIVPPVIDPFFPAVLEEGTRFRLLCSVNRGTPPIIISWYKDGRPLETTVSSVTEQHLDEFSSTLIFPNVQIQHGGNYTCEARNDAGKASYTATMVIHAPPKWIVEPSNTIAVLDNDVTMPCEAEGFPKPQAVWKKADGGVSSSYRVLLTNARVQTFSNGSLFVRNLEETDSGYYMCQANNGIGPGLSSVIQLSVKVPAHYREEFKAETIRRGDTLKIVCKAYGDKPISTVIRKDGVSLDTTLDSRYSIQETVMEDSVRTELQIHSSDRRDSSLYTCSAVNSYGRDEMNIQIIVQERPDRPTKVTVDSFRSRSVTLSWSPPFTGNSPISRYTIMYKEENGSRPSRNVTVPGTETSVKIKNLLPATTYEFEVFGENALGPGEASQKVTTTTEEEVPGGPPTNVHIQAISSKALLIKWEPPVKELQYGKLRGYYIGYRASGQASFIYKTLDERENKDNKFLLLNLKRSTEYAVVVQAYNDKGAGPVSDKAIGRTLDKDVPAPPYLEAVSVSSSSINLKWSLEEENINTVKDFLLKYHSERSGLEEVRVGGSLRSYELRNLSCGTKYSLTLSSLDEDETNELLGNTVSVKTDGEAPIPPMQEEFLKVNSNSVALNLDTWKDGGCNIKFMTVEYRLEDSSDEWKLLEDRIEVTDTPYIISDLQSSAHYIVKVTAHNEAGIVDVLYSFFTSNRKDYDPLPTTQSASYPFLASPVIITSVSVTSSVVIAVILIMLLLTRRRVMSIGDSSEAGGIRKDGAGESVPMTELETKRMSMSDGNRGKKFSEPYFPELTISRDGPHSLTDIRDLERPYDVPFPTSHGDMKRSIARKGKPPVAARNFEHVYSFPVRLDAHLTSEDSDHPVSTHHRWPKSLVDEISAETSIKQTAS